jgi:hypothetical protein
VVAGGVGGVVEHRGATTELRVAKGHRFRGRRRHSTVRPSDTPSFKVKTECITFICARIKFYT